jgi:hypothetical protein
VGDRDHLPLCIIETVVDAVLEGSKVEVDDRKRVITDVANRLGVSKALAGCWFFPVCLYLLGGEMRI